MRSDNHELSSTRILMLGIICCIVVANIYFNQSVLNLIAGSFPNEWGAVSLIPMVTSRLCGGLILSDPPGRLY